MKDLFNMGGYGFYVWLSYGATIVIFVVFYIISGKKLQTAKAKIQRFLRRTGQAQ